MTTDIKSPPVVHVRFTRDQNRLLRSIKSATGMSISEIARRAGQYALPLFFSGEVNVATLQPGLAASKAPKRKGKK